MIAAEPRRVAEVELISSKLQRDEYLQQARTWRARGFRSNTEAWIRAARVWHRRVLAAKRELRLAQAVS